MTDVTSVLLLLEPRAALEIEIAVIESSNAERTHADRERPVSGGAKVDACQKCPIYGFHRGMIQGAEIPLETRLVNGSHLFEKDNRFAAEALTRCYKHMRGKPVLRGVARNSSTDDGWAVQISNVILQNQKRSDASLLRTDNWIQVGNVNLTALDFFQIHALILLND